jgi:peptidoglycan biosynthesis protein MviN/MurJ (putative lipid II flippase)
MFFIYVAIISVTFAFLHSAFKYNSYLSLAAGIIITSCALITLYNYFNLDSPAEEQKWEPITWIATGVVVFYPVVNISLAFYNHITKYNAVIFDMLLYNAVPVIMSIFMYGCFTFAFYLCRKKI